MKAAVGIALGLLAGLAAAEPLCIEDGYDVMSGERESYVARPTARAPVITVDPERVEPYWLDDPDRPGLLGR